MDSQVLRNLFERLFPNIYHHIAIIHKQSQTKLFRKLGNFLRKTNRVNAFM